MLFRDVVELISISTSTDEWGYAAEQETSREVFANKKSIRQSEFYQAAAVGLRPELMFEVRSAEYQGEKQLKYGDVKYNVLRAYDKNGELTELVVAGLVNEYGNA